jgi:broad specificity phosphatase PhoE
MDEPLEERAAMQAARLAGRFGVMDAVWVSPALRARQTAELAGLAGTEEPAFRECDYGRWRGVSLGEIHAAEPEALALWMSGMGATPHGGESFRAMLSRVGTWLQHHAGDSGHAVIVTHATVMRTAIVHVLQAPPSAFWTIDVEPFGIVEMTSNGRRWALRLPGAER